MTKRTALAICAFACLLLTSTMSAAQTNKVPGVGSGRATAAIRISPDLAEVVSMTRAGMTEDKIIANVKAWPRPYYLKSEDATQLRKLGVSAKVISAMRAHDKQLFKQLKGAHGKVEKPVPEEGEREVVSPKVLGGSPVGHYETQMRSEEPPLIWRQAPLAATNVPPRNRRPWTSSNIVEEAPPPPQLERTPNSPGAGYVWMAGNWEWRGGKWSWRSGRWVHRPTPEADWMDGKWQQHGRNWIWIPGQWR